MTAFSKHTIETPHVGNMLLTGSFAPNGSSATAAANIRANWILGADQTATGTYVVTLKPEFRSMNGPVAIVASLRMGSGALSFARAGAYDASAGTITIYTFTEAAGTTALADIAADADSWIDVIAVFQHNPVVDGSNVQ